MRARVVWIVVGSLAVLALALRGALPLVLEDRVVQAAREFGLDVSLRDISLSLLAGELVLEDVSVSDPELGELPFLAADRASVVLRWLPLVDGTIHLEHVRLRGVRWQGAVVDGAMRLPRGLAGTGDPAPAEPLGTAGPPRTLDRNQVPGPTPGTGWPVRVDVASVESFEIVFQLEGGKPLAMTLDARVEALVLGDRSDAPAAFPVRAELELADGTVALEGNFGLVPEFRMGARIEAEGLSLATLAAAAAPDVSPWLREGELSVKLLLNHGADGALQLGGEANVRSLGIRAPEHEELSLEIPRLRVPIEAVRFPDPLEVRLGTIAIDAPSVSVRVPAPELDPFLTEGDGAAAGTPPDIRIDAVQIEEGSVRLRVVGEADEPPFELGFAELHVDAGDPDRKENAIDRFSLTALVEGDAPLHVDGTLEAGRGAATLVLEGMDLLPFQPLVSRADFELRGGTASLRSDITWAGEETRLANDVTVRELGLAATGGGFRETYGLPLNVALALMTDLEGAIRLNVPILINASESGVNLGPVLRGALADAIVGAISSPLKIVGGLASAVRGDDDTAALGANEIAMRHESETPTPRGEDTLATWARLLTSRPKLGIEVRGIAYLDEAADPAAREGLARRRAEVVRNLLSERAGGDPDRFVLGDADIVAPPATAADAEAAPEATAESGDGGATGPEAGAVAGPAPPPRAGASLRLDAGG